jgi:cation transporter-like permease
MNPDNVCIPYLTALGDFLGTAFLAFAFYCLPSTDLHDPHEIP